MLIHLQCWEEDAPTGSASTEKISGSLGAQCWRGNVLLHGSSCWNLTHRLLLWRALLLLREPPPPALPPFKLPNGSLTCFHDCLIMGLAALPTPAALFCNRKESDCYNLKCQSSSGLGTQSDNQAFSAAIFSCQIMQDAEQCHLQDCELVTQPGLFGVMWPGRDPDRAVNWALRVGQWIHPFALCCVLKGSSTTCQPDPNTSLLLLVRPRVSISLTTRPSGMAMHMFLMQVVRNPMYAKPGAHHLSYSHLHCLVFWIYSPPLFITEEGCHTVHFSRVNVMKRLPRKGFLHVKC